MKKISIKFAVAFSLAAILLTALFSGCTRRPLEREFGGAMKVIVKCFWSLDNYPENPTGITIYLFREGDPAPRVITTTSVDRYEMNLGVGKYKLYVISQSPGEYWTFDFENMDSYDDAQVTLIENPSSWFARYTKVDDEVVVNNPENLAVGMAEPFEITQEMIDKYLKYYEQYEHDHIYDPREGWKGGDGSNHDYGGLDIIEVPVTPMNITSQLWVTVYAGNAHMIKGMRAATTGFARTFGLTQSTTAHESVSQALNEWQLEMLTKAEMKIGRLDGMITTFGLPDGAVPSPDRTPDLNISTLLVDNSTVHDYVFKVGDKITLEERNPGYRNLYRLILGSPDDPAIIIPEVDPAPGGGFTAGVADWEDEYNVDIPL